MLDEIIGARIKKLNHYKEEANPYPASIRRDMPINQALQKFAFLEKRKKKFSLVGRVRGLRDQGKIVFGDLSDAFGIIQFILNKDNLSNFSLLKNSLDIGDFLEINGIALKTKKGERSILAKSARIIVKSIRQLPSDWYGLNDEETRLRQRYLDLLLNEETKQLFIKKNVFWETIRNTLKKAGYLEVETAVLENIPGGAEAEPFITHHQALDTDFYLRISLELPLKKLLVGGYEKIFEIGRIFRNEGIDREHLQDYTQMECYSAYEDYNDLMRFVEKMYKTVIKKTCGNLITVYENKKINWGGKWPKLEYYDLFKKYSGIDLTKATKEQLFNKLVSLGGRPEKFFGRGRLIDLIYKKIVRSHLIQPCFLVNPPIDVEPLAKRLENDSNRVARFQVIAAGTELGKGFSELNDPIDQRKRFEEQMLLREKGDKEAQMIDEDFLEALEYGMPPAAGFGMSERLFAILMDKSVRETVFFPLMKPQNKGFV